MSSTISREDSSKEVNERDTSSSRKRRKCDPAFRNNKRMKLMDNREVSGNSTLDRLQRNIPARDLGEQRTLNDPELETFPSKRGHLFNLNVKLQACVKD